MRELAPHVTEHAQIKDALGKLADTVSPTGGIGSRPTAARATAKAPTRRRAAAARGGGPRKGQPTRTERFVEVLKANPGIRISEAAEQMGVAANYLHRIRNDLLKAGKIEKRGKGWAVK